MTLYFKDYEDNERPIAECKNMKEVNKAIDAFIAKCNADKPDEGAFIRWYTRTWAENGRTMFDVGSWSEFFFVDEVIV